MSESGERVRLRPTMLSDLDFVISVGMAQGKPQVEIESVMEFARFDKKPIAQFTCNPRR